MEISFEKHLQNLVHDRTPCASGNLCYITNDQKHLILPDGKLFVIGMDPNEKAMIKCDVVCTASTHAGLRAWCRDFQQFCHDHAHHCHPLWCFIPDHGGEWGFTCGNDATDDLPLRMLLAISRMSHTICRVISRVNMFPKSTGHSEIVRSCALPTTR